ncbi:Ubiquitin-conjugating enzyme E2 T [Podila verticillata]|nr:Ubiquitin-conjugating enzyme E2 T [Podila verticillata]
MLRMRKELEELEDSPREGIVCYPIDDNITHLQAEVSGPEDTPYFGGTFKIDIQIPERYPMEPPNCQFLTRVYHPNIDDQGRICLDILKKPPKGNWGPAMSVPTVLLSLRLLLANPNPDDPLLVEVAAEYKEHRELFRHKAAKYTQQYAKGNDTETNLIMTSAETTNMPATPTTQSADISSRELSRPPTPVVAEKRSLAKPMLKRPNLSMRLKASVFPSPQDTITASPTDLSSQSETATSFTKATCPEEPTEETFPQGPQPPHILIDNKSELAIPTVTASAASTPTHTESNSIEFEDEKMVKKAKLNDATSTPTSPSPQFEPAPIPRVEPEQVEFEPQPESTQPVEPELLQQRSAQQEEFHSTPISPRSTLLDGATSFKRSSSFAEKSTSHSKPNDRPLRELPAELPQMKLERTPSQETILDFDMKASQELSHPCPVQEPVPVIHSKHFAPLVCFTETDENKETEATKNIFHPPFSNRQQQPCLHNVIYLSEAQLAQET